MKAWQVAEVLETLARSMRGHPDVSVVSVELSDLAPMGTPRLPSVAVEIVTDAGLWKERQGSFTWTLDELKTWAYGAFDLAATKKHERERMLRSARGAGDGEPA